jgi:hypothetical protein
MSRSSGAGWGARAGRVAASLSSGGGTLLAYVLMRSPTKEILMKTILATVALAFLAAGCAADQDSETGQDQSELRTANEASASEATEMPSLENQSPSTVQTNCYLFCASDFQECIASGLGAQQCRLEQRFCIIDFCH